MANEIRTGGNPFLKRAEQIKAGGEIFRPEAAQPPRNRNTRKAALNLIPDTDTLYSMIDQARAALSRGIRWARGSILNLLV